MTTRGFDTEAARTFLGGRTPTRVTRLEVGIDALERGIARRSRRVVAPGWALPLLPLRMFVQPFVDVGVQRNLAASLEIARQENAPLTTPQPGARPGSGEGPA